MEDQKIIEKNIINDGGSVNFKCPNCSKAVIVRTKNERQIVTKYTCPECGYIGPN